MNTDEDLLARIGRFEDYCIQKKGLEGDIERALERRDEKAVEDVEIAERELKSTKQECAEIEARMEKARRGDFPSTMGSQGPVQGGSGAPKVTAQEGSPLSATITRPQSPGAQITRSRSYETLATSSLVPASIADSESLSGSVISCPEQSTTGTGYKSLDAPEDTTSDDFLAFLVQRYADLCLDRRGLQNDIEEKLDRKERMAQEKVRCAKIALDTTRQGAVEIVAALMDASGGDAQVRVPRSNIPSADAHSDRVSEEEFRYPSETGTGTASLRNSSFCSESSLHGKSSKAMPGSPPPPPVASKSPFQHTRTLHSDLVTATSTLPPSMTRKAVVQAPTKVVPVPNPPVEEWEAAIFQMYENLMPVAIAAGNGVSCIKLPWPVLEFEANYYSTNTIKDKDIQQDVISDFIHTYSIWNGWSFQTTREKMKLDWESVQRVFPEDRTGKKRVDSVVKCIIAAV